MIETARLHDVACVRDFDHASVLGELSVGDEIPEALYQAVAEILRDVWKKGPTG